MLCGDNTEIKPKNKYDLNNPNVMLCRNYEDEIDNKDDEIDWEKAMTHTLEMKKEAELLGPSGIFYVHGCNEYIERYNNGDRSKDLYESMMDLH